jgi:hypothetical protein
MELTATEVRQLCVEIQAERVRTGNQPYNEGYLIRLLRKPLPLDLTMIVSITAGVIAQALKKDGE